MLPPPFLYSHASQQTLPARSSASTLASSTSARATVVLDDANEDILRAVGAVGSDPEAPMSSGSVGLERRAVCPRVDLPNLPEFLK